MSKVMQNYMSVIDQSFHETWSGAGKGMPMPVCIDFIKIQVLLVHSKYGTYICLLYEGKDSTVPAAFTREI